MGPCNSETVQKPPEQNTTPAAMRIHRHEKLPGIVGHVGWKEYHNLMEPARSMGVVTQQGTPVDVDVGWKEYHNLMEPAHSMGVVTQRDTPVDVDVGWKEYHNPMEPVRSMGVVAQRDTPVEVMHHWRVHQTV